MDDVTLNMQVFIHSNARTNEPEEWDWFTVTGADIPQDLMKYLFDDGEDGIINDLESFAGLDLDWPYNVTARFSKEYGNSEYSYRWYLAEVTKAERENLDDIDDEQLPQDTTS